MLRLAHRLADAVSFGIVHSKELASSSPSDKVPSARGARRAPPRTPDARSGCESGEVCRVRRRHLDAGHLRVFRQRAAAIAGQPLARFLRHRRRGMGQRKSSHAGGTHRFEVVGGHAEVVAVGDAGKDDAGFARAAQRLIDRQRARRPWGPQQCVAAISCSCGRAAANRVTRAVSRPHARACPSALFRHRRTRATRQVSSPLARSPD